MQHNRPDFRHIATALFLLILLPVSLWGQDSVRIRDFESWNAIAIEKELFDGKLKLGFTQELRLDENSAHINNYFTSLNADYNLNKHLEFGLEYRYIRDNKDEKGYQNGHRVHLDTKYGHKIDRLKLDYRIRLQHRKNLPYGEKENPEMMNKIRLRGKAKYDFRNWKIDPWFSAELFYTSENYTVNYIESIDELKQVSGFETIRFTIGSAYNIKKVGKIGIYYRIEQEIESYPGVFNTPGTLHIVGVDFTFKL
ncbi:MAG: DUF2490 domain-containing protein [Bacteroidales bacterium]|nr:DUF2490 domain-containing protein [Bacteroidales bacterium]